jgi:hypothetical protein
MAEVEQVVSRTDRYVVVAKREGTPAQVAIEEDPRAGPAPGELDPLTGGKPGVADAVGDQL